MIELYSISKGKDRVRNGSPFLWMFQSVIFDFQGYCRLNIRCARWSGLYLALSVKSILIRHIKKEAGVTSSFFIYTQCVMLILKQVQGDEEDVLV
jgi:hypothetical protein